MDPNVENRVLGSLDVIAPEVTALRVDVTELRSDLAAFRIETLER